MPDVLKPALGGLCVGLLALVSSDVLGTGSGLVQRVVDTPTPGLSSLQWLWLAHGFIVLALLKMIATSLTIGSGGSGGVFGPTLVIGGLVGAAAGSLAHALVPQLDPPSLPAFVMLGMAGFFAGVASAPIGAVLMVSEMTASYTLLAPLLIVCVVSLLLVRRYSLYQNQVESRFKSPAYRRLLVTDLLAEVAVNSTYHRVAMPVVKENVSAKDLRKVLADHEVLFPLTVVDEAGRPTAMLTMGSMRPVYFDEAQQALFLVRDMATPLVTCTPEESLASVLRKFEASNYSRIPVVSRTSENELLGYIQYQDIMVAYETELAKRRL